MKINRFYSFSTTSLLCVASGLAFASVVEAADQSVQQVGAVTIMTAPAQASQSAGIDFANAIPMQMPEVSPGLLTHQSNVAPVSFGTPGYSSGRAGNGEETPVRVPKSNFVSDGMAVAPQEFGATNHPFTTSRVNNYGDRTSRFYPYRPTGKLFFNIGEGTYVCSASLIKPGVIVTAAHCVADFGKQTFFSNWKFIPAHNSSLAPYGIWDGVAPVVMTSYFDGTDSCAVAGVVCQNDVAVIKLASQKNAKGRTYYAGNKAGWYGYGWNGYSYAPFLGQTAAQISQLGYPVALDSGNLMERTDSLGYVDAGAANNTIMGSLQTGGSSGGPWLVNLGKEPSLSGISFGTDASHNIVVGVTSWGYVDQVWKQQGASPFTDGNIIPLVNAVCEPAPQPGC